MALGNICLLKLTENESVGYGRGGGTKATADELTSIFDSLRQNELMIPGRLLTGSFQYTILDKDTVFI
jgi:hypothetical protein